MVLSQSSEVNSLKEADRQCHLLLEVSWHFSEVVVLVADDAEKVAQAGAAVLPVAPQIAAQVPAQLLLPAAADCLGGTCLQRLQHRLIHLCIQNAHQTADHISCILPALLTITHVVIRITGLL